MRLLALALTFFLLLANHSVAQENKTVAPAHIARAHGKSLPLKLELALDDASRERGLMNRSTLAPNDGMAFFFPTPAAYKFWMKDTLIPLDMLFVDEAGRIVYITTAMPLSLIPVGPDVPVRSVIDIAGGRAAREAIKVGDIVSYETDIPAGSLAH